MCVKTLLEVIFSRQKRKSISFGNTRRSNVRERVKQESFVCVCVCEIYVVPVKVRASIRGKLMELNDALLSEAPRESLDVSLGIFMNIVCISLGVSLGALRAHLSTTFSNDFFIFGQRTGRALISARRRDARAPRAPTRLRCHPAAREGRPRQAPQTSRRITNARPSRAAQNGGPRGVAGARSRPCQRVLGLSSTTHSGCAMTRLRDPDGHHN